MFSCELGGSKTSLLGAGVDGFLVLDIGLGFALGIELALVVSFKHVEESGAGETFESGDDAGPGEDF